MRGERLTVLICTLGHEGRGCPGELSACKDPSVNK